MLEVGFSDRGGMLGKCLFDPHKKQCYRPEGAIGLRDFGVLSHDSE
jgi:hypothetical protein